MASRQSTMAAREDRRRRVIALYCRGRTQREIAAELGIGGGTVTGDIRAARQEWAEANRSSLTEKLCRELARIDHIEREAWDAWEASKRDEATFATELKIGANQALPDAAAAALPGEKKVKETKRGRLAEARYLETIRWCVEQRCQLGGLYAPTKFTATDPTGTKGYLRWEAEELEQFVAGLTDEELGVLEGMESKLPGIGKLPAPAVFTEPMPAG